MRHKGDKMNPIGIIGAMDVEIAGILAKMTDTTTHSASGLDFHTGRLAGRDVVVAKCRIGKVNAAMCATTMINKFSPRAMINLGVAGAIHDALNIGDVVVSQNLVQHDVDVTSARYEPGQVPGLEAFLPADKNLANLAAAACAAVFDGLNNKAHVATIATGDVFVSDRAVKQRIADTFGAYCVEMEGGAIAQVCHLMDTPFVVIRAISDKADGGAKVDFDEFVVTSADYSAQIVARLVGEL